MNTTGTSPSSLPFQQWMVSATNQHAPLQSYHCATEGPDHLRTTHRKRHALDGHQERPHESDLDVASPCKRPCMILSQIQEVQQECVETHDPLSHSNAQESNDMDMTTTKWDWWKRNSPIQQKEQKLQEKDVCYICRRHVGEGSDNNAQKDPGMPFNSLHKYFSAKPSMGRAQNGSPQSLSSPSLLSPNKTTSTNINQPKKGICSYCNRQLCDVCRLNCLSCRGVFCTICCRSSEQVYGYHMGHLCFECVPPNESISINKRCPSECNDSTANADDDESRMCLD